MAFETGILGPVEASLDGRPVALGSPKQRAVFALLVLNAGRVVSTDRFISELWAADAPHSPVSTLQVYISRLRQCLAADGDSVRLIRRSPGYQLDIADSSVDSRRFAALVAGARGVLVTDPAAARHLIDDALALVRGPVLADVLDALGPSTAADAQRLEAELLRGRELRLEALLAQGDFDLAAADAETLARAHPLREDLHALLMLALYRGGRQGDALSAYDSVRDRLADELGVDPNTALRRLHSQILRHDPGLDVPHPLTVPAAVQSAVAVQDAAARERDLTVGDANADASVGALPRPLTSFVARDDEVGEVVASLGRVRLTALVGPGGCGKTRLALAAVSRAQAGTADATWWVDVSGVDDPVGLHRLVATAVGGRASADQLPIEATVTHLRDRDGLLVLDNCEHLVATCAEIVHRLLTACPGLRILVTTREPLGLPSELIWPVQPLEAPSASGPTTAATVAGYPAVRLWCARAATAVPSFRLTAANADLVARICRRLDGLPLAIELAAARLRVLSLEEIAGALDDQLEFLVGADRGTPDRHRTLRATLHWSYRLLSADEQRLLARLSVFQGEFTLEAVSAIRGPDAHAPSSLDLISQLIDRSLVTVAGRGRATRYRLLETVRLYAAEQLAESGRAVAVRDRHLRHFLDLAETAEPQLIGPAQRDWLDRLDADMANFTAALQWSLQSDPDAGLRLACALWRFWYLRGYYAAGRDWLATALDAATNTPPELRAKALAVGGNLAYLQCDYEPAARLLHAARAIYHSLADDLGVATAVQSLACVARERAGYAECIALHHESMALWRAAGSPDGEARTWNYLGFASWLAQDFEAAVAHCVRALAFFAANADDEGIAWALIVQGAVASYGGDPAAAAPLLDESLRRSREAGYREGVAWSLNELGVVAAHQGAHQTARALLTESLREHWDLGDRWRAASVLEGLAGAEAHVGDALTAARLLGAATELRTRLGAPIPPVETADVDSTRAMLLTRIGRPGLEPALAAGRVAPLDSIVSAALAGNPQ